MWCTEFPYCVGTSSAHNYAGANLNNGSRRNYPSLCSLDLRDDLLKTQYSSFTLKKHKYKCSYPQFIYFYIFKEYITDY